MDIYKSRDTEIDMTEKDNLINVIIKTIIKVTGVDKEKLKEEYWDLPLTGAWYGLSAIDLIYILFELEKHYRIRISSEHFDEYQFSTIRNICKVMEESMKS